MTWRDCAVHDHRLAMPAGQRVGQRRARGRGCRAAGPAPPSAALAPSRTCRHRAPSAPVSSAEQRGFARAVRPDDAHPVAAQDPRRQAAHDHPLAEGLGHVLRHRRRACRRSRPRPPPASPRRRRPAPPGAAPRSACRFAEPPHVALAPRGDAVAQPVLLHRRSCGRACGASRSSCSSTSSRQASKCGEAALQPPGRAAVEPHHRRATARSSSRRSWLISTSAERSAASSASSHAIAGRSRWLVGSSSSRMSGAGASTRASAARRASPPDSCAGSSSPVRPSCSSRQRARCGSSPGPSPAST